jgi:hypothetical protein
MNFRLPQLLHPRPSVRLAADLGFGAFKISSRLKSGNFPGVFFRFFFGVNFDSVKKLSGSGWI